MNKYLGIVAIALIASAAIAADCIPFDKAKDHVGSNACVTGKVLHVGHSKSGTTFLDFCDDVKSCPFVVVIFARDLRDVGDVDKLEGKEIQVSGKIEEFNGRSEIILKDVKQLRGEAANIPPLPKNYDVERRGNFSAGSKTPSSSGKTNTSSTRRRDTGGTADEE